MVTSGVSAPPATGVYSAFHVAVTHAPAGSNPHPARLRGRTIIVGAGAPLVSAAEGVEADTAFGAVVGEISEVEGHWPDHAWLVTFERSAEDEPRTLYRRLEDRWEKVTAWAGRSAPFTSWQGGVVMDVLQGPGTEVTRTERLAFFGSDGREKPLPKSRLIRSPDPDAAWQAPPEVDSAAAVADSLFVTAQPERPSRLMVERWRAGATTSDLFELAPRFARAHLWTNGERDVVAFGGSLRKDESPVLSQFDGERWTPIEAPPGVDFIVNFDRSPDGTQRVFAFRGKELSCWEQHPGSGWQTLALPAVGEGESIDGHWLTEGDAWVRIQGSHGDERLLRLRPVRHVYQLGDPPSREPVAAAEGRVFAAPRLDPAAAVVAPDDPSPFHDAVFSYLDREDGELANLLHLCPLHGHTLVCGVSEAPLISTEDGVVSDDDLEARIAAGKANRIEGAFEVAFGSWPRAAWLVTTGVGTAQKRAYRFDGGAWAPFATWTEHAFAADERVTSWGGALLIAPSAAHDADQGLAEYALGFVLAGTGHLRPTGTRVVDARPLSHPELPPVRSLAHVDDALFIVARAEKRLVVERQLSGPRDEASDRVDVLTDLTDGEDSHVAATLWAATRDDAVVFGSVTRTREEGEQPILQRFDGKKWSPLAVPSGVTRIAAYDRTSQGRDRIFSYSGEALSLFERDRDAPGDAASSWRAVVLPTLAPHESIHEVSLANDDAWLLVWPENSSKSPVRLMRLKPVKRAWSYPRALPRALGW